MDAVPADITALASMSVFSGNASGYCNEFIRSPLCKSAIYLVRNVLEPKSRVFNLTTAELAL